jgi:hypothetical protein
MRARLTRRALASVAAAAAAAPPAAAPQQPLLALLDAAALAARARWASPGFWVLVATAVFLVLFGGAAWSHETREQRKRIARFVRAHGCRAHARARAQA